MIGHSMKKVKRYYLITLTHMLKTVSAFKNTRIYVLRIRETNMELVNHAQQLSLLISLNLDGFTCYGIFL